MPLCHASLLPSWIVAGCVYFCICMAPANVGTSILASIATTALETRNVIHLETPLFRWYATMSYRLNTAVLTALACECDEIMTWDSGRGTPIWYRTSSGIQRRVLAVLLAVWLYQLICRRFNVRTHAIDFSYRSSGIVCRPDCSCYLLYYSHPFLSYCKLLRCLNLDEAFGCNLVLYAYLPLSLVRNRPNRVDYSAGFLDIVSSVFQFSWAWHNDGLLCMGTFHADLFPLLKPYVLLLLICSHSAALSASHRVELMMRSMVVFVMQFGLEHLMFCLSQESSRPCLHAAFDNMDIAMS